MIVVNYLKCLVRKTQPDCYFLMETKGKSKAMEKICRKLGYFNFEIVEANGLAGDLIMMWKSDLAMKVI